MFSAADVAAVACSGCPVENRGEREREKDIEKSAQLGVRVRLSHAVTSINQHYVQDIPCARVTNCPDRKKVRYETPPATPATRLDRGVHVSRAG